MAVPSVTDDFVNVQDFETLVGFGIGSVGAPNALITTYRVQGANAVDGRITGTGVSGMGFDTGAPTLDLSASHIFLWVRTLDQVATRANHGWRIRLATDASATASFKDLTVSGEDTARARVAGFNSFCANALRSGENITGTPPVASAVRSVAAIADHQSATTRFTWVMDQIKRGTGLTVIGGTSGAPGTSLDISADDETQGRGQFKNISGVFYLVGRITIGDTAAVISHYVDANRVWLFEDLPVKNDFNRLVCVGNAGVVNVATFGSQVGVGLAAVGVGGYTFAAAGPSTACFRVICTDANIDANFFGCNFLNSLYEDHCYQAWLDNGGAFLDRTRDANVTGLAGATMFDAAEAIGDAFYVGDRDEPFFGAEVLFTTPAVTPSTLAWEYHNGTTWVALPNLSDGTGALTANGRVTWAKPADWASTTVGGVAAFYLRVRIVSGTFGTNPLLDKFRLLHAGPIRLEHANAVAKSCLFSGCGPIIVRNGATVRKCTITASNAGRAGALDLGSTDPAADTVRDLQIQDSVVGVRMHDTAPVDQTFSFRNFKFTNNTFDARIDYPAASTVTISILDDGDPAPTIDNVNGSTVLIVASVNVTVNVTDQSGAAVQGALVFVQAAVGPFNDTSQIIRKLTDVSGVATEVHSYLGDLATVVFVRKKGFKHFKGTSIIKKSTGFTLPVVMITDASAE